MFRSFIAAEFSEDEREGVATGEGGDWARRKRHRLSKRRDFPGDIERAGR